MKLNDSELNSVSGGNSPEVVTYACNICGQPASKQKFTYKDANGTTITENKCLCPGCMGNYIEELERNNNMILRIEAIL